MRIAVIATNNYQFKEFTDVVLGNGNKEISFTNIKNLDDIRGREFNAVLILEGPVDIQTIMQTLQRLRG